MMENKRAHSIVVLKPDQKRPLET